MEQWEPPKPGQHWMEWLVSMMQDKETWETKYANYQLDKTKKIAYVIAKNTARPAELTEKNSRRIAQAFAAIGWRVMNGSQRAENKRASSNYTALSSSVYPHSYAMTPDN